MMLYITVWSGFFFFLSKKAQILLESRYICEKCQRVYKHEEFTNPLHYLL